MDYRRELEERVRQESLARRPAHADPLRNRCAVTRALARMAEHLYHARQDIERHEEVLAPDHFDFTHVESTLSDHEQRITELES